MEKAREGPVGITDLIVSVAEKEGTARLGYMLGGEVSERVLGCRFFPLMKRRTKRPGPDNPAWWWSWPTALSLHAWRFLTKLSILLSISVRQAS